MSSQNSEITPQVPPRNTKASRYSKTQYDQSNDDFSVQLKQIKQGKASGKKSISINHLLDFQGYTDLDEYSSRVTNKLLKLKRNKLFQSKVHLHGMSFINVNYKFIVDNTKEYKSQVLDPNVPLPVDDIIRIVAPFGHVCPICLSDEVIAPRMITLCGHILCLKCIISLLESEVPAAKKKQSNVVIEKYKECPLCSLVIRKNEIKPVLMTGSTELDIPKVGDEIVLTLMSRTLGGILALPVSFTDPENVSGLAVSLTDPDVFATSVLSQSDAKPSDTSIPWIDGNLNQFLRIFKADLPYLISMYEKEKEEIKACHEEEKVIYQEPDTYVKMALDNIDKEIQQWTDKLNQQVPKKNSQKDKPHYTDTTFYFYQTGFNLSTTFVLSPLDAKLLKNCYGNYTNLPSSVVSKVEHIRYEELTSETALSKYKYLSHLPLGSQIGFIECNWYGNPHLTQDIWESFKEDLSKRTRTHQNKIKREERDKKRAIEEEETRSRNFFERENNGEPEEEMVYSSFKLMSIADSLGPDLIVPEGEFTTTVWGTRIPKAEEEEEEEDLETKEMIQRARDEMNRMDGKKKKKKVVLW